MAAESVQQLLTAYLDYLKYERGYSTNTLKTYQQALSQLIEFLAEDFSDWQSLNENHISQWLMDLHKRNISAKSIQLKVSALRGLYSFLQHKHGITNNPCELISLPKADRRLPNNMDVDEINRLLQFQPETTIEFRDKAMMELFYSSGVRLSELANCQLADCDLTNQELTVTGKGNKQRIVPIGRHAKEAITQWLTVRGEFNNQDSDSVFLSKLGNPISTRQIQQRLKHWAQQQGLNNNLHPHKLRHSFASHILQSSGDLRAVQELLGHANLSTTQVYTHLDFQHLAQVYDSAHPRAKKKR